MKNEGMKGSLITVNEYHLSGDDMKIVFHNGDDETMTLQCNDKVFKGRALYRDNMSMGLVVSTMMEAVPDLRVTILSVAIPGAQRPANAKSVPISTFAVLSTGRTSIAGPSLVEGQLITYKVVPLHGNAW
jgi:hypothetical protein